jgi:hypothetical protein
LTRIEYFDNPASYFSLVFDPSVIIRDINMVNENLIGVTYCKEDDFVEVMGNTNPVIAAYTTTHARLKLYSYIERLEDRVLYFDTDSLIYLSNMDRPSEYTVPTGWCLGEMTDELKEYGPDSYIKEFVSGGPKNYAYRVHSINDGLPSEHFVIKVRGITLSNLAVKKINFYSLRRMVYAFVKFNTRETIDVVSVRIERKKDRKIVTKTMCKQFRIVYDKRVVSKNFKTFPYGYIR